MKNKQDAKSMVDKLPITDFMIVAKHLDLFIGNLSALCHISGVMGIPTMTIFAGQFSPYECQPLGNFSMSIRTGLNCSPCYKTFPEQCSYSLKCLTAITPIDAYKAINKLLTIAGKI